VVERDAPSLVLAIGAVTDAAVALFEIDQCRDAKFVEIISNEKGYFQFHLESD
jgi:hypothetical protein